MRQRKRYIRRAYNAVFGPLYAKWVGKRLDEGRTVSDWELLLFRENRLPHIWGTKPKKKYNPQQWVLHKTKPTYTLRPAVVRNLQGSV